MFLTILGILIITVAHYVLKNNAATFRYTSLGYITGIVMVFIGISISSIVQIGAGQIGVKILFGKVQDDVLYSGLHFVNPVVEVKILEAKTQNYTMSAVHDEGDQQGDDAIRVLTKDGLEVIIDLTVLYRILPDVAPRLLRETGADYKDKIIRPIARTKIRDNAVYYDAVELYSTKRDTFQMRIFNTLEEDFNKRGLILEQMLVRNIDLPASVKKTIESKINAEQDAQKMQFVLQKEKQEAERKRVEAQGIADYQRIVSLELNDKMLQYETIKANKEIAISPNTKVIIMGGKNTPVIIDGK
ncbi:MAG: prohibitin family protein [Bacteroidetes bacterium]|nr:prohibitin family protein [Bacteroidota bacterium]